MKWAIDSRSGNPELIPVYDSLEDADAELGRRQDKIEKEMEQWKVEARAALEKDELYRGGGVLVLAELMQKHSAITGLRAGMKHWKQ